MKKYMRRCKDCNKIFSLIQYKRPNHKLSCPKCYRGVYPLAYEFLGYK